MGKSSHLISCHGLPNSTLNRCLHQKPTFPDIALKTEKDLETELPEKHLHFCQRNHEALSCKSREDVSVLMVINFPFRL